MHDPVSGPSAATWYSTSAPEGGYLSPEMLLLYLERQLDHTDSEIAVLMAKQERGNAESALLNRLNAALTGFPDDPKLATGDDHKAVMAVIDELIALDPELAVEIWGSLGHGAEVAESPPGSGNYNFGISKDVTKDDIKALRANAGNLVDERDSSSQMNMIRLQSKISDRGNAISMSTNLVSSLGKSLDAVVGNIGR